jgi:hypothetical protein
MTNPTPEDYALAHEIMENDPRARDIAQAIADARKDGAQAALRAVRIRFDVMSRPDSKLTETEIAVALAEVLR